MALRLPDHTTPAHASAAPPGDCRGHGAAYAGRRLTPCPAYGACDLP
ncbi:hypothetical protein J4733_06255 [Klebsiella pneumoniae]|uniref:Uncharacterized protein n=1 Tax=Klebsiella pneumoniae TaxID=573 RepID=A0A939NL72_KLEPN|nr:hypothetical protein [Klebsiella pneumoniae]